MFNRITSRERFLRRHATDLDHSANEVATLIDEDFVFQFYLLNYFWLLNQRFLNCFKRNIRYVVIDLNRGKLSFNPVNIRTSLLHRYVTCDTIYDTL